MEEKSKVIRRPVLKPKTFGEDEWKLILGLLLIELVSLGYMYFKGAGFLFLQTMLVLIPASFISCVWVLRYRANRLLVLMTFLMLNFGFVSQYLTSDNPKQVIGMTLLKYTFAFLAAYIVGFIFYKGSSLIRLDAMIPVITVIQLSLWAVLFVTGVIQKLKEQEDNNQTAIINLSLGPISIQPMEVIKILYIFVIVAILCKKEQKESKILGIPRDLYMVLYTMVIACCSLLVSEMGSFLVMLVIGGLMMLAYSQNRMGTFVAGIVAMISLVLGWNIGARFLREKIGVVNKIYMRFTTFLKPELAGDYGVQGFAARKALTVGELFGPDADKYLVAIPRANDDMIFSTFVQNCGLIMGIMMILAIFIIFYQGFQIGTKVKDSYYGGLAVGISLLFAIESIIHIGYNIGILPITGIPLYLVSEGVTSMTTGLALMAILLIISTEVLPERTKEDEDRMERKFKKVVFSVFPKRNRVRNESED